MLTVHVAGGATAAYNISLAWWLDGVLDAGALHAALTAVVERHMVLRTTYEMAAKDGGFTQCVHGVPEGDALLVEGEAATVAVAEALAAEDASRGFKLIGEGSGVMRCTLVRVEAGLHLLLINVHHVAFDGGSTDVLLGELGALYRALSGGGVAADAGLTELPAQYVEYALWQRSEAVELLVGSLGCGQIPPPSLGPAHACSFVFPATR